MEVPSLWVAEARRQYQSATVAVVVDQGSSADAAERLAVRPSAGLVGPSWAAGVSLEPLVALTPSEEQGCVVAHWLGA